MIVTLHRVLYGNETSPDLNEGAIVNLYT